MSDVLHKGGTQTAKYMYMHILTHALCRKGGPMQALTSLYKLKSHWGGGGGAGPLQPPPSSATGVIYASEPPPTYAEIGGHQDLESDGAKRYQSNLYCMAMAGMILS